MKPGIKKIFNIRMISLLLVLLVPVLLYADGPEEPGGEVDVPIDGGLSVLLAAGVGYGIRELKKKRHK